MSSLTLVAWIRVVFCQGPRQVINALTLYSVFQAKLDPSKSNDVGDALLTFFKNVEILAEQQHQQAFILSGMIFTLVVWIFSALSLILAILFYLLFLWHYIPNQDGGLIGFCERKINGRLTKIVSAKVNKAIEEEERKRAKADQKAAKKGEKVGGRQATVPVLFDSKDDDKLPDMPMLNRADTFATLPQYQSRPGTPSGNFPQTASFELENLDQKRPLPGRSITGASYASNAPLINNASDMGRLADLPPIDTDMPFPAPQRSNTGGSQGGQWQRGPPGPQGPPRMPSAMGDRGYTTSPLSYADGRNTPGFPGPQRQNTMDYYGRPIPRSHTPMGPGPAPSIGRRTPFDPSRQNPQNRLMSPTSEYASEYGRQTTFNPTYQNQHQGYSSGPSFNSYNDQGRSSPAPGSEFGAPRAPFNYNAQGRSSPAPGSEFGRRSPFDPTLQENARSSPAPSNMGKGYNQNVRPQPSNQGGYNTFNPNSISQHPISPVGPENGEFDFGTGISSLPQVRNYTDPIPRAATAGPSTRQMRVNGNGLGNRNGPENRNGMRNEDYGDEEMGMENLRPPRRAATDLDAFSGGARDRERETYDQGQNLGQGRRRQDGSEGSESRFGGYR